MNIDCRVEEHEGSLMLSTTIESSNLTPPPAQNVSGPDQPVIRQVRADLSTVVNLGKPTLITSMDDPISRRQFQIEVTATKTR